MRADGRVKADGAAIDFSRRAGPSRRDKRAALVFHQADVSTTPPQRSLGNLDLCCRPVRAGRDASHPSLFQKVLLVLMGFKGTSALNSI